MARGTVPIRNISLRTRAAWRMRQNRREQRQQEEFRSTRRRDAKYCRVETPARVSGNQTSDHLRSGCRVVKNENISNEILENMKTCSMNALQWLLTRHQRMV